MANFITKFFSGLGQKVETLIVGAFIGIIGYVMVMKYLNKEYPFNGQTKKTKSKKQIAKTVAVSPETML